MKQAEKMQDMRRDEPVSVLEELTGKLEQMDDDMLWQINLLVQGMRLARVLGNREAV